MQDLKGAVAIVTGGNRGYGAGIAEVLKKQGCRVWITGRDQAALDATAQRLGVHAVRADVACAADWDRLFAEVLQTAGRLDILVNNAGAGIKIAPVADQTDASIEESIAINLTGVILGCRRAAPVMQKQRAGTIINISSVCARHAWPGFAVYGAAKAGLVHFTKHLYTELRDSGVRVTSLIPSWGATDWAAAANLPVAAPDVRAKSIQPLEIGELVAQICALPPHLVIQDVTLWPLVQKVNPL